MASELRYALGTLAVLLVTMLIPGGRVLVLPESFVLILILIFWAAKPRTEE
jgi:hypothetical protein